MNHCSTGSRYLHERTKVRPAFGTLRLYFYRIMASLVSVQRNVKIVYGWLEETGIRCMEQGRASQQVKE